MTEKLLFGDTPLPVEVKENGRTFVTKRWAGGNGAKLESLMVHTPSEIGDDTLMVIAENPVMMIQLLKIALKILE